MSSDITHQICRGFFLLALVLDGTACVRADEVVLLNGDRLSGKVLSLAGGKLEFESKPLGKLTIDVAQIRSVQTDESTTMVLEEGAPAVKARLVGGKDGIYLDNPERQRIELGSVLALGNAAEKLDESRKDKFKWSGKLEFGLSGRRGNTKRADTQADGSFEGKNSIWTLAGYTNWRYGEQKAKNKTALTDDEVKWGGRVQRSIRDGISTFVALNFERDRIEDLRLRTIANVGLGICWLKNTRWFYETRFGVGCQRERFDREQPDSDPCSDRTHTTIVSDSSTVGTAISDLRYKINDYIDLSQQTTWLPDFQRQNSYRVKAESAATIYLDKKHHFFIKTGIRHKYDNQPTGYSDNPPDKSLDRVDVHYFSNLGYQF